MNGNRYDNGGLDSSFLMVRVPPFFPHCLTAPQNNPHLFLHDFCNRLQIGDSLMQLVSLLSYFVFYKLITPVVKINSSFVLKE